MYRSQRRIIYESRGTGTGTGASSMDDSDRSTSFSTAWPLPAPGALSGLWGGASEQAAQGRDTKRVAREKRGAVGTRPLSDRWSTSRRQAPISVGLGVKSVGR